MRGRRSIRTAALLVAAWTGVGAVPVHAGGTTPAPAVRPCALRPAGAHVPGTVLTGGRILSLVSDPLTGHNFVASAPGIDSSMSGCASGIATLDGWSGRIIGFAPLGASGWGVTPGSMAVHSMAHRLLMVVPGPDSTTPGSVRFVDTRTGRLLGITAIGSRPGAIAVDQHTYRAFVAETPSMTALQSDVAVLAVTRGTLLRTVHVAQFVDDIAVDDRTNRVFLITSGSVTTLDGATGDIVNTVSLPFIDYQIHGYGVDEVTGRLFVLSLGLAPPDSNVNGNPPSVITVIDTTTGAIVGAVKEGSTVYAGGSLIVDPPLGIVISTQTNTDSTAASILDARTGEVRRNITLALPPGAFNGPTAVDRSTGHVFGFTGKGIREIVPGRWRKTRAVSAAPFLLGQSLLVDVRTHRLFSLDQRGSTFTVRAYCTVAGCT